MIPGVLPGFSHWSAGADVRWQALKSAGVDLWPPINELTPRLGQLTARQTERGELEEVQLPGAAAIEPIHKNLATSSQSGADVASSEPPCDVAATAPGTFSQFTPSRQAA
jgi:hypothetical protein